MSQVVRALEGNISLEDLNEGSAPGHSRVFGSFESSSYDSVQYSEDMKNFRKLALESQEQGISEYSGPSSDYGRHPSVSTSSGQQNTQEIELGERAGQQPWLWDKLLIDESHVFQNYASDISLLVHTHETGTGTYNVSIFCRSNILIGLHTMNSTYLELCLFFSPVIFTV